ncbi:unnamed protein product [Mytilus edulis]|uniref:Tc1-like transposase DDE domain-containing protein n=2 Tax=Mytilus TaxID=6548 RepID=A0A8S3V7Y7_MYTED|nr:unnamed protein product [Mytilus edulis]
MEKKIGKPWCLSDPWSRMVKATGISLSTLKRKIEALDPVQDAVKEVHKSSVQKPGPKPWKLDDFNRNVVKRTIYDMYRKKEVVSMPRLHEVLKEKDITASLSTVVRTVKSLGFRFSKKGSGRRHVVERDDVVALRHHYLRQIRKYRQQERHIVYLDETWLNSNHVVKGDWLDEPSTSMSVFEPHCAGSGRSLPSGKGTRLIILDAGSSQHGLIPGVGLIFESKTNSSDYHDEMNSEHFTEWFRDTLIPRLSPQSVVVMDNAPYHSHLDPESRAPSTGANKPGISAWLDKNNVHYDPKMKKTGLLDLVNQHKPQKKYVIDELAKAHGHVVLRLPPYHCELNPIEMVWSDLKGFVARKNSTYKIKDCKKLFEEAKSHFSAERWAKFETHVVREYEEKLWQIDGLRDKALSPVIIHMTDDETDDSQATIVYCQEGGTDDEEIDMDIVDGYVSDTSDQADVILCKICHDTDPPGRVPKRDRGTHIDWFQCDTCDQWLHNKCCTKPALAQIMCPRCYSLLHHRNLSETLVSPLDDVEQ